MSIRNINFFGFIWHSFWLSLAETFTEKNTVLPALILLNGGTQFDVGILTSIMIGAPLISQLLFASYLTNKQFKKKFLLGGIYLRVIAFVGVAVSIYFFNEMNSRIFVFVIFLWMSLFAFSGAFAGVSYSDIVGKVFDSSTRKKFFVLRQFISSFGILISALVVNHILSTIQYPKNYQISFFTAGLLLFLGSLGFLFLKEKPSNVETNHGNFFKILIKIPDEIKSSANLKNFIVAANLIGLSFVLIPFYIGFVKNSFDFNNSQVGNFLIVQIIGMIFSNILWGKIVKIISFKGMLRIAVLLLFFLSITALVLVQFNNVDYFYILFILIGFSISAHKIAVEGVIIEISNEINRPL
jgi:MFS family permease